PASGRTPKSAILTVSRLTRDGQIFGKQHRRRIAIALRGNSQSTRRSAQAQPSRNCRHAILLLADHSDLVELVELAAARAANGRAAAAPPTKCDELAPHHSTTASAVAISATGTFSPSALAVLRLMASSNLVGCSTGRSLGLAPFRILSTVVAPRRNASGQFAPSNIR